MLYKHVHHQAHYRTLMLNKRFAQILGSYSSEHDRFHCRVEKNRQGEATVSPHLMQLWRKSGLRVGEPDHPL